MEPDKIRFGGGSPFTVLHPLVAAAMVLAIVLILFLPRKYVVVPALLALFFIPPGQVIVAVGIHLNIFRVIILAGLARYAASGRSFSRVGGFNFMDRVVTGWALSYLIIYSLQYRDVQAVVKSVGDCLDGLGGYLVLRFLIQDREDVRRTIKVLATVAIVNAICMLNEQRTGADVFALLGGMIDEVVRDGKIRSQGSFAIFITAGSFGATLPPLMIWLWSEGEAKIISLLGLVAATIMTVTCYASTTLVAYAAGIVALCLWPIRKHMRILRWGIVVVLVGLHLVMHGPVWSLLEHIDLTGSSSSYHRYMLIDNSIRHFGDWWLLGTRDNGSWGWEMWDTSNQYVAYAFTGGVLTVILFIAIISIGFSNLGKARKVVEPNRREEWFLWCLGATMFSHVVAFFGIGYFDQVRFAWFALLAIISVAVFEATHSAIPQVQESPPSNHELGAPNGLGLEKVKPTRLRRRYDVA
jgi:hypothetical protein